MTRETNNKVLMAFSVCSTSNPFTIVILILFLKKLDAYNNAMRLVVE